MFGKGEKSFKYFYTKQNLLNGRFEATGEVSDPVTAPYNESR